MFENCFSVAAISARIRASAPTPGEAVARYRRRVAVPDVGVVPLTFKRRIESGFPVGWGAEQFDRSVRVLLIREVARAPFTERRTGEQELDRGGGNSKRWGDALDREDSGTITQRVRELREVDLHRVAI